MGLLDGILGQMAGSVLGSGAGGQSPLSSIVASLAGGNQAQGGALIAAAMSMLQQGGGLPGVLSRLQQGGLGNEVESWVGTGANAPVSGDQLTHAFGADAIGQIAGRLGMPTAQAGAALAQLLPELVNQLTPDGRVPDNHGDLLAQGLDMLKSLGIQAR